SARRAPGPAPQRASGAGQRRGRRARRPARLVGGGGRGHRGRCRRHMGHGDRSLLALPAASHHVRGKGDARYLGGYHRPGDAGRCGRGRAHSGVVTDRWDIVVVGAGPAGATTALLLARAGASVLLMDRARFPRDKACSEYLSPATTEILERLGGGILDAVEGAAHAKLYGMKVVAPCGATMCGRFRGGPRPYSFALPRTTFDTILVAAAARAGAQVRQATTVENLLWEGGAVAGVTARSCNP